MASTPRSMTSTALHMARSWSTGTRPKQYPHEPIGRTTTASSKDRPKILEQKRNSMLTLDQRFTFQDQSVAWGSIGDGAHIVHDDAPEAIVGALLRNL